MSIVAAHASGLKAYRVAEHVDEFLVSSTDELTLKKYGFRFTEAESSPRKYYRLSKQDGRIVIEKNFP